MAEVLKVDVCGPWLEVDASFRASDQVVVQLD